MDTWDGSLVACALGSRVARARGISIFAGAGPGPDSAPTDAGIRSWVSPRCGLLGLGTMGADFDGELGVGMLGVFQQSTAKSRMLSLFFFAVSLRLFYGYLHEVGRIRLQLETQTSRQIL